MRQFHKYVAVDWKEKLTFSKVTLYALFMLVDIVLNTSLDSKIYLCLKCQSTKSVKYNLTLDNTEHSVPLVEYYLSVKVIDKLIFDCSDFFHTQSL